MRFSIQWVLIALLAVTALTALTELPAVLVRLVFSLSRIM